MSHRIARPAAGLLAWAAALPCQDILFARMEDPPAVARLLADAVEVGLSGGLDARKRMVAPLNEVSSGQRSGQIGLMLERLALAVHAGRGVEPSALARFADALFLHALPEVQDAGGEAHVYLSVRLLLPLEVPLGLQVVFRILDPLTERRVAEQVFPQEIIQHDIQVYQVRARFEVAELSPGRYLAESELRAPGFEPVLLRRTAFTLLSGFRTALNVLAARYEALRNRDDRSDLLACLESLLGELQRPIDPARGELPRVESDLAARLTQALAWSDRMLRGIDPLDGLQGDLLLGVRSTEGVVMPLRVHIPPKLPPKGARTALLFLPGGLGDESDLPLLHGRGRLPGLAARHSLVVASLQSGFVRRGGDVIGPAREFLERRLGVTPGAVTIGGHGRGASQAFYSVLPDPSLWGGLVLVSGPPADPTRLAPIPKGRTFYVVGEDDPGRAFLARAEEVAASGLLRFLSVPGAEHYLALSVALGPVLEFAAAGPATVR